MAVVGFEPPTPGFGILIATAELYKTMLATMANDPYLCFGAN